ncbi:MAG: hypothetical protein J5836_02815 [Clostridia bacterium]|nr:hypothetical protein [Clostridia bacterium]
MAKRKGIFARLIEGPERSETYAASTLPTNRWELGFDVFKNNKGKLVGLNLLTLVFFIPFILLLFMRYVNKISLTNAYPFGHNLSGGYPYYPASSGLENQLELALNQQFFLYLLIAVAVAAVGISGGFYVMRNLVWTESVTVGSDFFKGVKKNYFIVFFSLLFYSVILALSVLSINVSSYIIATGEGTKWLLIASQAISYVIIFFGGVMLLFMITLGVNYKLKFGSLLKNSFILALGLLPLNVLYAALGAVLFLLFLLPISLTFVLAVLLCLIFSLSMFMLVWTNYSQWVFDQYINDKVAGAKKNRGIYKPQRDESAEVSVGKSNNLGKNVKPITDYDVEIYELPESFSRKDLARLEETKEAMRQDSDRYAFEHAEDGEGKDTSVESNFEGGSDNKEGDSD